MHFATFLPAILSNRKSRVRLRLMGETLKRNGICRRIEDDLPPFIVPHLELDLLNRSPVEWPQVQAVDNPMHCEV